MKKPNSFAIWMALLFTLVGTLPWSSALLVGDKHLPSTAGWLGDMLICLGRPGLLATEWIYRGHALMVAIPIDMIGNWIFYFIFFRLCALLVNSQKAMKGDRA